MPMSKCKFIRERILAKQRDPGYRGGDVIELDYRRFEKKTMKHFLDALYSCNAQPIPIPQIVERTKNIAEQMSKEVVPLAQVNFTPAYRQKQFLDSAFCENILWNISIGYLTEIGGKIYV